MAWPSTISAFSNPSPTDRLNSPSHSSVETAQNTGLTEIQTYIGTITGVNASVQGTLLYDIKSPNSDGGGHVQTANKGGTGQTTYMKGDILVASDSSVLSKISAGSEGEVLQVNSMAPVGVLWGSVAGIPTSVQTMIPRPQAMVGTSANKAVNSSIFGYVGQVVIPFPIRASTIAVMSGAGVNGPGTVDFTLYREDGSSSVLTFTTPTIAIPFTSYVSGIGPVKTIQPGNYYAMINSNIGTDTNMTFWGSETGSSSVATLNNLRNAPVIQGLYSILTGTPPASIITSAIVSVVSGSLDVTSNTPYFRIN